MDAGKTPESLLNCDPHGHARVPVPASERENVEMLMQIDFISLFDAVRAVALRIEVSEDEVDFYSGPLTENSPLGRMLARAPARQCFQESRAAVRLLKCLFNTPSAPRWFDMNLTGFPLQSYDAQKEGRDELVRLANQEQEFKANVDRMHRPQSRWRDDDSDIRSQETPFLDFPKLPRSCGIGFDRTELIGLLSENCVSHNLGDLPPHREEETKNSIAVLSVATNSSTQAEPSSSRPKKRRQFRGPEAEVLSMAEERARDPDDYRSVWAAFVELARGANPPFPILGYIAGEEKVQIIDEKTDGVRYFTKENMRKRIR